METDLSGSNVRTQENDLEHDVENQMNGIIAENEVDDEISDAKNWVSKVKGSKKIVYDGTSFNKCANGDVELSVNITNDPEMSYSYLYSWYIGGELVQEDASGIFVH